MGGMTPPGGSMCAVACREWQIIFNYLTDNLNYEISLFTRLNRKSCVANILPGCPSTQSA
jgi:hypothetical protein